MPGSLRPHGLQPTRLLCPQNFLGNTRLVCHFLLQRIFLTQGSNPRLLHLLHGKTDSLGNPYCCSIAQSCLSVTPKIAALQASLSLFKLTFLESVMAFSHLTLCHHLLLLPSVFSSITVFSNESTLDIWWPKLWSFSFSISTSNEYSGLIPFRMDWLDLLAVQRTFKSLLQHHSSKASILWHLAFFMVQLSHLYITTGKALALTNENLCQQSNMSAF